LENGIRFYKEASRKYILLYNFVVFVVMYPRIKFFWGAVLHLLVTRFQVFRSNVQELFVDVLAVEDEDSVLPGNVWM
jgi:hypothetical protein